MRSYAFSYHALKRQRQRIEKHLLDGFRAIEEEDYEMAERHFRAAEHNLGIAIAAFRAKSWERAMNKAFAVLSEAEPGSDDEAVALKILAVASPRMKEGVRGTAQKRREALSKRAKERLDGVEWRQVHGRLRELARKQPMVYGSLASERMGRKLVERGLHAAADLLLAGDFHRAACIGDDMNKINPTSASLVAEFSLCPHCLEEFTEPSPNEPVTALSQLLAREFVPIMFEIEGKSPEQNLILGVSALHLAEYLTHRGENADRLMMRAEAIYRAAVPPQSLAPQVSERWKACIAYCQGCLLQLRKDETGALVLLDEVASGSAVPWNERAQETAGGIRRRRDAEARRQRLAKLRGDLEAARRRHDEAAELPALMILVTETEADLSQLERLARLRAEARDPGWTETATAAVRLGSRDGYLLGRIAEEAIHRWSAGDARESLNLFRLARRIGQLPSEAMSTYAAVLVSLNHPADAGRAYAAAGRDRPELFMESARCFLTAGETGRALAAVQALFASPASAALWEEALRLIEDSAPAAALIVIARKVLEQYPSSAVAHAALTRAEADEFRAATEERERKRNEAREASQKGAWQRASDVLESVPERLRDGELWNILARAYEALNNAEDSLRCYEAVSPTTESLAGRARSLARLRRYGEARQALEQMLEYLEPEEQPELGTDQNLRGLWAQVRGDLRGAAQRMEDEELLHSLVEVARKQNDILTELEALANLAPRRPAYSDELTTRVRAIESSLPLKAKARFVRGRLPILVLCDTNVLLSRVFHGVSLPEELRDLRRLQSAERFEVLRSQKESTVLAVTDTVAGELRSLLLYQKATQEDEEAAGVLETAMQRAESLVSELHVERVASSSPRPPPEYAEKVRSFYRALGPRLRAITKRKVSRQPERSTTILRRRGVSKHGPGRLPMPELVDQRLLAEAASLVDGPLPGFSGVGILSDDTDFRSFSREIEVAFGVTIC